MVQLWRERSLALRRMFPRFSRTRGISGRSFRGKNRALTRCLSPRADVARYDTVAMRELHLLALAAS